MENENPMWKRQIPPDYISIDELPSRNMRENVAIITQHLMKRIENFARAQYYKMKKRGVNVEYLLHTEPVGIGARLDLFVKPYKSEYEEKLVLLVMEEGTKRIENFARGVMNLFRYRGLLIEHYTRRYYDELAIHDEIGVTPIAIRTDLFKKLHGKNIVYKAVKFLDEPKSNEYLYFDRKRAKENYLGEDKALKEKVKEILDNNVKGEKLYDDDTETDSKG